MNTFPLTDDDERMIRSVARSLAAENHEREDMEQEARVALLIYPLQKPSRRRQEAVRAMQSYLGKQELYSRRHTPPVQPPEDTAALGCLVAELAVAIGLLSPRAATLFGFQMAGLDRRACMFVMNLCDEKYEQLVTIIDMSKPIDTVDS